LCAVARAFVNAARQKLKSYGVILAIFFFLLAAAIAASWGGVKVIDSARAYVAGESRYSKAEKNELNLESAPGVGTTVTVSLPAMRVAIAAPQPLRSAGA
jgi:hypothetical protein